MDQVLILSVCKIHIDWVGVDKVSRHEDMQTEGRAEGLKERLETNV